MDVVAANRTSTPPGSPRSSSARLSRATYDIVLATKAFMPMSDDLSWTDGQPGTRPLRTYMNFYGAALGVHFIKINLIRFHVRRGYYHQFCQAASGVFVLN